MNHETSNQTAGAPAVASSGLLGFSDDDEPCTCGKCGNKSMGWTWPSPSLCDQCAPKPMPPVLDACCSTRMMWFDKQDTRTLYVDRREGTRIIDVGTPGTIGRTPKTVAPDMLVDFRSLPFPDESFWHVVFDPPHLHKGAGATGRIAFDFGLLDATWRDDLRAGFSECFRVLKPMGTLIFKWCEAEIPLREVLALTPERPLYGHRSGKKAQTHWCAFLKHNDQAMPQEERRR